MKITWTRLKKALSDLSSNAAPGPDGITADCLKRGGLKMEIYMVKLFRRSLDNADVPNMMREALISPIFKGGETRLCSNYRPVALTGHIGKVMERIIRPQLMDYLEANELLDPGQHGCRPGRSTFTQLLQQYNMCLDLLLEGSNIDIIYLDFAKAFDKVDLSILMKKLRDLGISGRLGHWIGNFITSRKQRIRVGDKVSDWKDVASGVPQGSVLGPLLFLVHIWDLGRDLGPSEGTILKFVDDTKLVKPVKTEEDIEDLQKTLNKLYDWQEANNMEYNGRKFQLLRLGKDESLKNDTSLFSADYNDIIEPNDWVRDLGIAVNNRANFRTQRDQALIKIKKKAGWILRTFGSRDPRLLRSLWKALVQPLVDYCGQLWHPTNVGEVQELEQLLRAYTRKVEGLRQVSYWDRLRALKMMSLQRRSERYKILYLWKIKMGLVPNCNITWSNRDSRKGTKIIIPKYQGTCLRYKTLNESSLRVEGAWLFNCLPKTIRNLSGSLDSFKATLDSFLDTLPDEPYIQPDMIPCSMNIENQPSNSIKDWVRTLRISDFDIYMDDEEETEEEGARLDIV